MSQIFSRKILPAVIAASFAAEAATVMAQTILEEVVVTARKREESILKVPVTVSVFSGQVLDDFAVTDVKGIADLTPGLNFSNGPLNSGVLVSMRGIGTGTNNPAVDQSVALVADGMQFTQGLAFKVASFDMAQVEVLKGPQALFFGKAAPAGVISIRTADPGEEAEFRVRAGYEFEASEQQYQAIASGPVTDTLGLRLAAQYSDSDGYFSNDAVLSDFTSPPIGSLGAVPPTEDNLPGTESILLRGTALWNPSDSFSARLKLNYADDDTQGSGGEPQLISCPEGTDSLLNPINFIGGQKCKLDDKSNFAYMNADDFPGIYNNGKPFFEVEQAFGSLELNYDLGDDLTLTSITGYYDVDSKSMINGSLTTQLGTPFAIQGHMQRDDFTQELRLTSDYAGSLNFMLGAFYQDGELKYLNRLPANAAFADLGRGSLPPALYFYDNKVDSSTYSVFGQILWDITPDLELGVGTRWTSEDREHKITDLLPTLAGEPGAVVPFANPSIGDDNWSPEVSLTWTPSYDLTIYGNIKQAWKSGSFDVGAAWEEGDDLSFGDERVRGGELGLKSLWLDGSLAFNAAAYYYEYKDMQVTASQPFTEEGKIGVRTTNAASSDIYGIDSEISYSPDALEGLTLSGGLNWNHAEYDEFPNSNCYNAQLWDEGCNVDLNGDGIGDAQDLSNDELLRAPEWMADFTIQYQTAVFNDMTLMLGSNTSYSDDYSATSTNIPSGYQDSYVKTSATVSLSGPKDQWKVELIGDNLTDEIVYGNCNPAGYTNTLLLGGTPAFAGTGTVNGGLAGKAENACYADRGRSVWVRLTWNFI